jgi:peroxin-6
MIYVGFPKSIAEKKKILVAQTKKFNLFEDVNFDDLANLCPEDYSGADIYAVCSLAFTLALKNFLENNDNKIGIGKDNNNKNKDKVLFYVKSIDFINSINKVSPSISREELNKYEELKKKYS